MAPKASKMLIPIALGLSACGLSAYLVYLYFKKEEYGSENSSCSKTHELKIPKEAVPAIIGRGGSNIKQIQEKSGAQINFKDERPGEEERICIIRGNNDNIQMAKLLIDETISNLALIETVEMWVPQKACGRIIGRCGENVHKMSRNSNAKIYIEQPSNQDPSHDRRIMITGTLEQIEVAKSLIEAKVLEDAELRQTLAQRQPRGKPRSPLPGATSPGSSKTTLIDSKLREKLSTTGQIDGQIEVYVSAVEDPGKFWVQIVGPKANELDQLVEQMSDYYSKPENCELHRLDSVSVGDLVAAVFQFDSKWYRAEVVDLKKDIDESDMVELYFVDYGDSDIVKRSDVYELRTDFLRLRFQAIECFLAKIGPTDGSWSVEAIDLFENLTQVAQWKKLMSKIVTYRERDASNSNGRARREGSPIPGVELYDSTKSGDVNIAEELVKNGFATYDKDGGLSPGGSSTRSLSDRSSSETRDISPLPTTGTKPLTINIPPKKLPATNDSPKPVDKVEIKKEDNGKKEKSGGSKTPPAPKEKPRVDFSPKFLKDEPQLPKVTPRKFEGKNVKPSSLSYTPPKATEYSSSESEDDDNANGDTNLNDTKVPTKNGNFERGDNMGIKDSLNNVKGKKQAAAMMLDSERSGSGDFVSNSKTTNENNA